MNRIKSVLPGLIMGAALMMLGPTTALAQRGGGGHGGHSGGGFSGRSFSGGGARSFSGGAVRGFSGGGFSGGAYAAFPAAECAAFRAAGVALSLPAAALAADSSVAEGRSFPAGSTPAEAITTADASGHGLTSASGSGFRSAGVTMPARAAASMTVTATGCRLPAIRACTPVTNASPVRFRHGGSRSRRLPTVTGSCRRCARSRSRS